MEFSCSSENSSAAVSVVCESVVEIRSGLESCCTPVQSSHWDLKLAAFCTWRTLASYGQRSGDDVPQSIPDCDLIHSLPDWNFTFYFSIVVQNQWTKYFVEVFSIFFALLETDSISFLL